MSPTALRRTATILLAATLTVCNAAPPEHAAPGWAGRRAGEAARAEPGYGILAFLLRLIVKSGGAMDPNG